MVWKKVNVGAIDIKKEPVGKTFIGTYVGFKKITTDLGEGIVWEFYDQQNKPFSIFGFTSLNMLMGKVSPGILCRISYEGQSDTKNKYGKYSHLASVEVDEDTIEESKDGEFIEE